MFLFILAVAPQPEVFNVYIWLSQNSLLIRDCMRFWESNSDRTCTTKAH